MHLGIHPDGPLNSPDTHPVGRDLLLPVLHVVRASEISQKDSVHSCVTARIHFQNVILLA